MVLIQKAEIKHELSHGLTLFTGRYSQQTQTLKEVGGLQMNY
jgi:hypothetical protein